MVMERALIEERTGTPKEYLRQLQEAKLKEEVAKSEVLRLQGNLRTQQRNVLQTIQQAEALLSVIRKEATTARHTLGESERRFADAIVAAASQYLSTLAANERAQEERRIRAAAAAMFASTSGDESAADRISTFGTNFGRPPPPLSTAVNSQYLERSDVRLFCDETTRRPACEAEVLIEARRRRLATLDGLLVRNEPARVWGRTPLALGTRRPAPSG